MTIFLAVTTAVCAFGWLKNRLALLNILYYIAWKELPMPNDEQMKYCAGKAVRKFFRVKDRTGL